MIGWSQTSPFGDVRSGEGGGSPISGHTARALTALLRRSPWVQRLDGGAEDGGGSAGGFGRVTNVDTVRRYLTRPPALWQKVLLPVVVVLVTVGLADRRGWGVAIVAVIVYGAIGVAFISFHDQLVAFSQDHPVLDASLFAPLLFIALAYMSELSIVLCIVIALAGGAVLMGVKYIQKRRSDVS